MFAFSTFTDVIFGYTVVGAVLAGAAWRLVNRGKALGRQVPDQEKPWL
jgi:hypothetical protein